MTYYVGKEHEQSNSRNALKTSEILTQNHYIYFIVYTPIKSPFENDPLSVLPLF